MSIKRHEQQFERFPSPSRQIKTISLIRIIIVCGVFLIIIVGAALWIYYGRTPWYTVLPIIIFTSLGIVIALFQWLFPVTSHQTHLLTEDEKTDIKIRNKPSSAASRDVQIEKEEMMIDSHKILTTIEETQIHYASLFQFNEPLINSDQFFGRLRERTTLINRARRGASTSIVGPRRIGKTWLISYLKLVAPRELGSNFRIGYLDASMPSCATISGFAGKALQELGVTVLNNSNLGLDKLEQVIIDLNSKNQNPVLCIDEFEGFNNNQEFDLDFFRGLRAITQAGLSLVVASKHPLLNIVSHEIKTSPFFNIFEQITLKPFNFEEAEQFVHYKSTQGGFTGQEESILLKYGRQSGQQWPPIRLQLVGKLLQEDKMLATHKSPLYYRPEDPTYRRDFEERLEEKYKGAVN